MKRLIASFFAMLFIVAVFAVPAFAADAREPSPGLISERIVTDDEGNTGIIRVYKLDENGEIPGYQTHEFCTILQHGFQPLIGALSSLSKKFKVCLKMPLTVTIKELVH